MTIPNSSNNNNASHDIDNRWNTQNYMLFTFVLQISLLKRISLLQIAFFIFKTFIVLMKTVSKLNMLFLHN